MYQVLPIQVYRIPRFTHMYRTIFYVKPHAEVWFERNTPIIVNND